MGHSLRPLIAEVQGPSCSKSKPMTTNLLNEILGEHRRPRCVYSEARETFEVVLTDPPPKLILSFRTERTGVGLAAGRVLNLLMAMRIAISRCR